jgi:hypothetical protein
MYNQPTKRFPKRLAEFLFPDVDPRKIRDAHLNTSGSLIVELNDGSKRVTKIPGKLDPATLARLERRLVFGKLILQGYTIKKVEGGYKCINGEGVEYHLQDETCECKDFTYNLGEREPCKHLLFKDAFLELLEIFTN